MQIFDELKARGLEEGAKAIFPKAVVQRCIVHLVRNSIKYVFTQSLKRVY